MSVRGVQVVVPHSGLLLPAEIDAESLSDRFADLVRNIDWHTDRLYDFRDLLGCRLSLFPYCSLILEANRHPDRIDDCVPLRDVYGEPVYRPGREPSPALRRALADRYLRPFHRSLGDAIAAGGEFLLDGHSTVPARGVAENQIDIMNFQHSPLDDGPLRFSPAVFAEAYAEELRRRLPEARVTVNASEYFHVYGHVAAAHAIESFARVDRRVPALVQETSERLYKSEGRTPNLRALDRLRRAFAFSLAAALDRVGGMAGPSSGA